MKELKIPSKYDFQERVETEKISRELWPLVTVIHSLNNALS